VERDVTLVPLLVHAGKVLNIVQSIRILYITLCSNWRPLTKREFLATFHDSLREPAVVRGALRGSRYFPRTDLPHWRRRRNQPGFFVMDNGEIQTIKAEKKSENDREIPCLSTHPCSYAHHLIGE